MLFAACSTTVLCSQQRVSIQTLTECARHCGQMSILSFTWVFTVFLFLFVTYEILDLYAFRSSEHIFWRFKVLRFWFCKVHIEQYSRIRVMIQVLHTRATFGILLFLSRDLYGNLQGFVSRDRDLQGSSAFFCISFDLLCFCYITLQLFAAS